MLLRFASRSSHTNSTLELTLDTIQNKAVLLFRSYPCLGMLQAYSYSGLLNSIALVAIQVCLA